MGGMMVMSLASSSFRFPNWQNPTSSSRRHGAREHRAVAMRCSPAAVLTHWRRAFGQRINLEGIVTIAGVVLRSPHLALPHACVGDIRFVDWEALRRAGFRGVVFDKDNTLTAPYRRELWPSIVPAFRQCCDSFPPGMVAMLSNSAGLRQYDPDYSEASALEASINGIHVIRHEIKKPAGTAEEVEKYFGCSASFLVMVGDRYFTDVVYGNRNGFFTILTESLTIFDESYIVRKVRKVEEYLINYWYKKGIRPPKHPLFCDPRGCVKGALF